MVANVALLAAAGGSATASSTLTPVSGTPSDAIDGNDTTFFRTNYLATNSTIITLDLGAIHQITLYRFHVAHNDNHGWQEAYDYSLDGSTWTQCFTRNTAVQDTGVQPFASPLYLRYLRFRGPVEDTGLGEQAFVYSIELYDPDAIAPTTPGTGGSDGSTQTGGPAYSGDLEAWLSNSSSANLHQSDGLPWLTKTVADAIKVVTDKLGHSGSGNSLDWVTALWRLAGDLTDAEIGYLKSLLDKQDQIVGGSGGGGSAFYGPSGTQVAEGVETLLAQGITPTDLGAAVALLRERLDLSPDLSDSTRWTLVDTIEGSADALVNVQADAYFVNLTTIPPEHEQLGIAATLWVPHWGWAAPRVHAHFRQRQFQDVFPVVFTADGLFMDGLLIHARPGFEWTCECYTLDRS